MVKVINFTPDGTPIHDALTLSSRIANCFLHANITTVEQLLNYSADELMRISQFGRNSLDEVARELARHKLSLKGAGAKVKLDEIEVHPQELLRITYERAFAAGRKVGYVEGAKACQEAINQIMNTPSAAPAATPPSLPYGPENRPIEDLDLSVRTLNSLKRADIDTVSQLINHSEEQLLSLPGFGRAGLDQIAEGLNGTRFNLQKDVSARRDSGGNNYEEE